MTPIETKLRELERLNCLFPDVQQLIAALREAVGALKEANEQFDIMAKGEGSEESVYMAISNNCFLNTKQALASIEKILNGEQK